MWIVESPFDGRTESIRKLLRPGKKYRIGRKEPVDLILAAQTVNKDAGYIEVARWSPAQRSIRDASALPDWPKVNLNITEGNHRTRIVPGYEEEAYYEYLERVAQRVRDGVSPSRDAQEENLPYRQALPGSPNELENDDILVFSKHAPSIRLTWQPFLLWVAPGAMKDHELRHSQAELAKYGIAIVCQEDEVAGASHYVVNAAEPNVSMLDALTLGLSIVTSDFIEELLETSIEKMESEYEHLDDKIFFPVETSMDDATYQELKVSVKRKTDRSDLLRGVTLLFLNEDRAARQASEHLTHIYQRTGATTVRLSMDDARKLTSTRAAAQMLKGHLQDANKAFAASHDKDAKNLIIITSKKDEDCSWYRAVARASLELDIAMPSDGPDALLKTILSAKIVPFLNEMAPAQPPEASLERVMDALPAPTQRTSLESQPAAVESQAIIPPTPSRRPKRRAGVERADAFADVFGSLSGSTQVPQQQIGGNSQVTEIGPTPMSTSTKQRRNVSDGKEQARRSDVWKSIVDGNEREATAQVTSVEAAEQERYTKRFRMELDESDRRATQKARQSQQLKDARVDDGDLTLKSAPRKRRAEQEAEDERDQRTSDGEGLGGENEPRDTSTQMTTDTQPLTAPPKEFVAEKPAKLGKDGARDDRYLLSLATMKKTRKKMDDMDEEFNKLRIVRPNLNAYGTKKDANGALFDEDLLNDPEYRAWQDMSIEDFDIGAAGNFVQVDFVPLLRKDKPVSEGGERRASTRYSGNPAWANRPNFKKFQSKNRESREPIEMTLSKIDDYGLGAHYDNDSRGRKAIQRYANGDASEQASQGPSNNATQKQKRSIFTQQSAGKASQRRDVGQKGRNEQAGRQTSQDVAVDLDLDDLDEEALAIDDSAIFDDEMRTSSSSKRRSTQTRSERAPAKTDVVNLADSDDDDDDLSDGGNQRGFSFKGFKRKKT